MVCKRCSRCNKAIRTKNCYQKKTDNGVMYFCGSECARLALGINKFEDARCAGCHFRIASPSKAFVTKDEKYFCCVHCALTYEGVFSGASREE